MITTIFFDLIFIITVLVVIIVIIIIIIIVVVVVIISITIGFSIVITITDYNLMFIVLHCIVHECDVLLSLGRVRGESNVQLSRHAASEFAHEGG